MYGWIVVAAVVADAFVRDSFLFYSTTLKDMTISLFRRDVKLKHIRRVAKWLKYAVHDRKVVSSIPNGKSHKYPLIQFT